MTTGKVGAKGRVTLPKEVRERLHLRAGDSLSYEMRPEGTVMMRKLKPVEAEWHQLLSAALAEEWNSPYDHEAFDDL